MQVKCIKEVMLDDGDVKCFTLGKLYIVEPCINGYLTKDDTGEDHFLSDNSDQEDKDDKSWFNEHFELV